MTYHIVAGNISSADFKNVMKVTSEEGGVLTFNISSTGLMVNNANVTKADIIASNGIIHVIDTVLGYKALATKPQTSKGWLDKGIALKDMHKYNEALKAIDEAIEKIHN
ncbi:MAG: fasciclin domain-containing protein [Methanotrichaceae archaeon]|nr:fasciclin domain-containing protein [Methanotrichaceae archaeon]